MSIVIDRELEQAILSFRTERDWEQFHNLRTLSTSLVIEAGELAELTQWTPDTELQCRAADVRERMEDEVADLLILLTYLIHDQDIDAQQVVRKKLAKNGRKYPVDAFKGTSRKYNE
ncbi:nucleotide pyrophosphohydrolase [Oleiagrimonas sp.]|jgi:NTP pyrophosphatase (non-canonical NTP hydrolase)|uniref:nucleotide pyrophosphohydrolase n=1 Tax=Oleiagrimonas sp. TaxID=2010330 RepID=UPI002619899D|nr:nucleotide pyrophosphohydrolase [Oleiagrimonas sp.]MDA3915285.1 nucleotide pyrophosphohydrolase [Oleiagrimonas sp.]